MASRRIQALSLCLIAMVTHASEPQLQIHNNRIFLPITINGHEQQALLDSAAEMTLVDDDFARKLHLQFKAQNTTCALQSMIRQAQET